MEHLVADIAKYFINGIPGDGCAVHLMLDLPEGVQALKPFLGDPTQLNGLVQQIPALAQFANGPATQHAWARFVSDFVAQMNGTEIEDEAEEDEVETPVPPNGSEGATPKPRAKRKKTVTEIPKPVN